VQPTQLITKLLLSHVYVSVCIILKQVGIIIQIILRIAAVVTSYTTASTPLDFPVICNKMHHSVLGTSLQVLLTRHLGFILNKLLSYFSKTKFRK
jgi:hypothetical protein